MKRILIYTALSAVLAGRLLFALCHPAAAQVALTPHWDASANPGQAPHQTARPVSIKTTAQLQADANEAWAYVRRLHPSW